MKVKTIMTTDVKSFGPDNGFVAVAHAMLNSTRGSLPVVEDGRVIGMITDRDICVALADKSQPLTATVQEVMSEQIYGCAPDDEIKDALKAMRKNKVRRLPVI